MKTGGGIFNGLVVAGIHFILFGILVGIIYLIVLFIGLFYKDAYKANPYLGYIWLGAIGLGFLMGFMIPDSENILTK